MRVNPRSLACLLCLLALAASASCVDPTSPSTGTPVASDSTETTPVAVAGILTPLEMAAGWRFVCATTTSGAYCWGTAFTGALGSDTKGLDLTRPTAVEGGGAIIQVSARWANACGVDTNGVGYCWGDNRFGQAGAGPTVGWVYQVRAVDTDLRFTQVAAGSYQSCGLTTVRDVYCWGNGATLGAGDGFGSIHPTPERVASDRHFVQITAGQAHTCALDDSGGAWCWGRNRDGELGDGQAQPATFVTTPRQVTGGHRFTSIAAGGFHACGLTVTGAAWCWGHNGYGQLGSASGGSGGVGQGHEASPVHVTGGQAFRRLYGGYYHTCGLTADGSAYCWGLAANGQLGIGPQAPEQCGAYPCALKPMAVSGELSFDILATGSDVTCGATLVGYLYCWGHKLALGTG